MRWRIGVATVGMLWTACVAGAGEVERGKATAGGTLRMMTLNMAVGGEAMGQPLEKSAEAIRAAGADVVGLQETAGRAVDGAAPPENGKRLAELLGWRYVELPNHCGIATRLEVADAAGGSGVRLRTAEGREFMVFDVHLPAAPYQPYQLLGIIYASGVVKLNTEEEGIRAAKGARGKQVEALAAEVRAARAKGTAVVVMGDFNEPSWQDWTEAAARAGLCPLKVEFPATKAMTELGLVDAYRAVHADPIARPGRTWTPTTRADDPNDRHDRIDFVFVGGAEVRKAEVVGEDQAEADVVVTPWPSDHRGVVATVEIK